jgi:curved DNA-binding protein CbpA
MTEDFYDLLEVPSDASQDEIKEAYREQVRVYHPDQNDDDRAQAQFTAVKTAYDVLGDPVERKAYDRLGHEEYVAKRTSGLPSPDVWASDDSSETDRSEAATVSASTGAGTGGGSATAGAAGTSRSGSATAGADASSATGSGTGGGSVSSGRTAEAGGASARDADRTTGTRGPSETAGPLRRWWRRRNFSLPLIWLSVLVYAAGLVHYGLANRAALGAFAAEARAIGADPSGLQTLLSAGRRGLETPTAFVRGVEVVSPPVAQPLWHEALAGGVAVVAVALLAVRAVHRTEPWGPVTIDETILVALALAVTTTLIGGPLLAGAVLMPLLFGVIVRRTRRLPGWTPSYLYVLPVFAPAVALGAGAAGYGTLATDSVAFVVLPLAGALGLPLRTTVRKHLGR